MLSFGIDLYNYQFKGNKRKITLIIVGCLSLKEQITIARAAEIMGVSQQTVRVGLQQGVFAFGAALKLPGSSRYTYVIYPKAFNTLFGELNGGESER